MEGMSKSQFSPVQFSRSIMSDALQPHGLQNARLPCPSQIPEFTQARVHRVSDAIQPSHPLFSSSPPAFSLSHHQGFFPVGQLFVLGGQRTGASASTSVLPINIQNVFPLGLTGSIHLQSKGSPLSAQKWVNYSL